MRLSLRLTLFDFLVLLFLATAALGVWAAYDRGPALAKLAVIAGAAAVYVIIARQPSERLGLLAHGLGLLGAGLGVYFLLTSDWNVQPADVAVLNRLGLAWMEARPTLPGYLHPNQAGGLLAMLAPFGLAAAWEAARARRWLAFALAAGAAVLTLTALLMTSSRGAWLALAAGLTLWAFWSACAAAEARWRWPARRLFLTGLALTGLGGIILVAVYPGGLVGLADLLPGLASGTSRWDLAVNTFHLAADFSFTGGGLRAFEGLYSRYAMVIQVPLFTYAHNFYLDVLLEQGFLGGLVLILLLAGSLARLAWAGPDAAGWRWATAASLVAVMAHGLLDDALYGNAGTPLLFVWAGMAATTTQEARLAWAWPVERRARFAPGAAALVVLALVARPMTASLLANLGAVEMARAELTGWPDHRNPQPNLSAARNWLERAVAVDAIQPVARHRLGLLTMRVDDYAAAAADLERAVAGDPGDRGARKALGYAYVWLGDFERAAPLLADLPEVPGELETYAWWWGTQGQTILSASAAAMAARLTAGP